jgi:hypothetical protein
MSSTTFLDVKVKPTGSASSPSAHLNDIALVSGSDLGNKPALDVKLIPNSPRAVFVNESGNVYQYTLGKGGKLLFVYSYGSILHFRNDYDSVRLVPHGRLSPRVATFGDFL